MDGSKMSLAKHKHLVLKEKLRRIDIDMKNFKLLQKELARNVRMRKLRDRRLLEDIIQVRHLPTHTVKEHRKYRLSGGRTVEVKTLSEMSL